MVQRGNYGDRQGEIYLSQIIVSHIGFSCLHRRLRGVGLERDDRLSLAFEGSS